MSTEPVSAGAWPTDGELFVGLVGPIGVDLESLTDAVMTSLDSVSYKSRLVRLTEVLRGLGGDFADVPDTPADARYHRLMDLGNELRQRIAAAEAMVMLGVWGIGSARDEMTTATKRRAYVLRQFKRPEEVTALRRLYGENFVLIAAYTREDHRVESLAQQIAASHNRMDPSEYRDVAQGLVRRDEREDAEKGQNLRDTFWRADLFVDPSDKQRLRSEVQRFIDLLYARRVATPTKDEFAMFQAWASAMRSGSLARQVGAVIFDDSGALIASGTNDVPRFGGGLYWEGDPDDARDHQLGQDANDQRRDQMIAEALERLAQHGWLAEGLINEEPAELARRALHDDPAPLEATRLASVLEYVRAVHAEQSAISDAARRGVATQDAQMAVTTFPCHECARLIVASGIRRVCYVEPYPKSLAAAMYSDSISVGRPELRKVRFEPFLGVSPRVYPRLFSAEDVQRKDDLGKVRVPAPEEAQLRLTFGGSRLELSEAEDAFTAPLTLLEAVGDPPLED